MNRGLYESKTQEIFQEMKKITKSLESLLERASQKVLKSFADKELQKKGAK